MTRNIFTVITTEGTGRGSLLKNSHVNWSPVIRITDAEVDSLIQTQKVRINESEQMLNLKRWS